MTLIAGSALSNGFTLIGDLVLSSDAPVVSQDGFIQQEIFLPSSGMMPTYPCLSTGNRVIGLAQKLCLVDKRLAIAWTGSYKCAVNVISHLRKKATGGYWTIERINKCLEDCLYEDLHGISMIALYYLSRDIIEIREWDADCIFESTTVGTCYSAGTGAKSFKDVVGMFDRFGGNMTRFIGEDNALSKMLLVTGTMLGNQALGKMYIDEYFGGAFELAYAERNRIKKLDQLGYFFWIIDPTFDNFKLLPLFIRCYYHGKHQEFLVVQRNDVRTKDNLGILLDDPRNIGFHTTVIAPTGLDIAAGDLRRVERAEKVDLNARHYVHYVIGICREQIYQASIIVMNDRKKTIRFDREGGASYLAVNQYLLDQIGQVVSDMREDTVSRSSDQSAGNRTRPT